MIRRPGYSTALIDQLFGHAQVVVDVEEDFPALTLQHGDKGRRPVAEYAPNTRVVFQRVGRATLSVDVNARLFRRGARPVAILLGWSGVCQTGRLGRLSDRPDVGGQHIAIPDGTP